MIGACLNKNCKGSKGISISQMPLGNPSAWMHPQAFSLYYGQCTRCHGQYCWQCIEENAGKCLTPGCGNRIEIKGPPLVPYRFYLKHREALHKWFAQNATDDGWGTSIGSGNIHIEFEAYMKSLGLGRRI